MPANPFPAPQPQAIHHARARRGKRCRRAATAIAMAAAVLAQRPAVAQWDTAAPTQDSAVLPEVLVVAAAPLPGIGVDSSLVPYTVQTVRGADLNGTRASNLADYLGRNLAGVNVNDIQGSPFQSDITYRGYRASSIAGVPQGLSVYLDGIRINEPFGDVISWDMIPEAALESVSMVSSANPAYGLNSLGGALAMTTRSGLDSPGFTADLSYGSGNRKRADLSGGVRGEGGWHAFAAGTLFQEHGWRDDSSGQLGNVFAKAGYAGETDSFDVSLLHGRSTLTGNGLVPAYHASGNGTEPDLYQLNRRAVYTYPDQTRNQLTQVAVNGRHWFDDKTSAAALAYVRTSRRDTTSGDVNPDYEAYAQACEDGFNADGSPRGDGCGFTRAEGAALHPAVVNTSHMRQQTVGVALSLARETGHHVLNAGISLDRSRLTYSQYAQPGSFTDDRGAVADAGAPNSLVSGVSGNARTFGIYLSDTWTLTPSTFLTASARWNLATVSNTLQNSDGSEQARESFTYRRLNPALGLVQKLGGGVSVFGGYAQNNRVPTVLELGCADPTQPCRLPAGLQADPYLKQVVSHAYETGVRWRPGKDTDLTATLYRIDNHDDILFLRAPNTQMGYFANFDRTRNQGLDLTARQRIGAVTLRFAYSYLQATYQATGQLAVGERTINVHPGMRMAGLPRHTLKFGADWQALAGLTLGADLVAVSDSAASGNEDGLRGDPQPDQPPKAANWHVPGYATVNLRAVYQFNKHFEVYARVANLLDRRYETYGQVANNVFPGGTLVQPHVAPGDSATALFVAPGAPRSVWLGVVYRM
ncbi:Vitamin B12 transporter BtuB [Cupriavidus yeoncheonensis]|uniref:Vitamin B12 transporter BtuB n=1 Tax=Cupriavidus yeoncheonensis TaxID=1462994 RepID=A0A916INM7_9BURK|nr:TonB-dependent receptor [Cupriavidus yeoncheonensis]CAG2127337.1 Vitamin B12 transporter BtuB [Cupriavidus yeoncheonensis]